MKPKAYKLLKKIDKMPQNAMNTDFIKALGKRKDGSKIFDELFEDELVREISQNPTQYSLTTKGREKLDQEKNCKKAQLTANIALIISFASLLFSLFKH